MIIQPIDNKKEAGFYNKGKILKTLEELFVDTPPWQELYAWKKSPLLSELKVQYGYVYSSGASLMEACPTFLRERWESCERKLQAFYKAAVHSKMDVKGLSLSDLAPEHFISDYFELRSQIIKSIFSEMTKPPNYDFMCEVYNLVCEIANNKLLLDTSLKCYERYKKYSDYIDYEIFGTKTGRLKTKKGSFPIMNLPKESRRLLKPHNDVFIELDFNAAELRTFLSLMGSPQPQEDLHDWNRQHIYPHLDRGDAKERIFAWLYNSSSKDFSPQKFYDKNLLVSRFFADGTIETPFNRILNCDEFHALNYLLQSTTSDLMLERAVAISKKLSSRKSYISFMLHDSLVMDFSYADRHLVEELVQIFSETSMGKYVCNLKMGRNFGDMQEVKLTN